MSQDAPDDERPPRTVSRFEANLLRILRFFLGQAPAEQALPLIEQSLPAPKCLSADAVHLIKDSLAKGGVIHLVRAGAWRRDRHLVAGKPVEGRLWRRAKPADIALEFSARSLEFLIWVTANKAREVKPFWRPADASKLTPADHLLLALAFGELRNDGGLLEKISGPGTVFGKSPLCWLMYPDDLADLGPERVPDFAPWFQGPAAAILEAVQALLASRWLRIEQSKSQVGDWHRMRVRGTAQSRVLENYLAAAEAANRPDLARFLMRSLSTLLARADLPVSFWTGGLQGNAPQRLADRLETQRAALAVPSQLTRLGDWRRRAQTRSWMDDDYPAAQLLLADWESHDLDAVARRADRLMRQLRPLRAGGGNGAGPTNQPEGSQT